MQTEIRARTRVQFTNPILADCLRQHAALFQYAGIEPEFDPEGCFFTVRDDLFPMPHTLSDFAPCLVRFLADTMTGRTLPPCVIGCAHRVQN